MDEPPCCALHFFLHREFSEAVGARCVQLTHSARGGGRGRSGSPSACLAGVCLKRTARGANPRTGFRLLHVSSWTLSSFPSSTSAVTGPRQSSVAIRKHNTWDFDEQVFDFSGTTAWLQGGSRPRLSFQVGHVRVEPFFRCRVDFGGFAAAPGQSSSRQAALSASFALSVSVLFIDCDSHRARLLLSRSFTRGTTSFWPRL